MAFDTETNRSVWASRFAKLLLLSIINFILPVLKKAVTAKTQSITKGCHVAMVLPQPRKGVIYGFLKWKVTLATLPNVSIGYDNK